MPKKKGQQKGQTQDVSINDFANAPKPVNRLKKSNVEKNSDDLNTWDQIDCEELDIANVTNVDGTKSIVYRKRTKLNSVQDTHIDDRPGIVYPEIVWYLISHYVQPEDVGRFAGINKTTYSITLRESFWRTLYRRYCENNSKLPDRLRLEKSYRQYGLRQRIIRSLYHTYGVFVQKIVQQASQDSRPHELVRWRCINVWYIKRAGYWSVYFKFRKQGNPFLRIETRLGWDMIEELSRIEANPEKDCQVLQVNCQSFYEVHPLMGMTLCSVSIRLAQGFRHQHLHLGFTSTDHNVGRNAVPECTVVLDTVVNMYVLDWWHPKYPHFDNTLPANVMLEEDGPVPVLKKDFFQADL